MTEIADVDGFAVVAFTKESDTLFVVPTTWLINSKQSFWPPYATDAKIIKAVKNREPVLENWSKHDIRILCIQGKKQFCFIFCNVSKCISL